MNETSLASARKIVLCVGLLAATLPILYPHWRVVVELGDRMLVFDQHVGRAFILSPPLVAAKAIGLPRIGSIQPIFRINYTRLFIEVAVALIFTFGLMRALRRRLPSEG